MKSANQGGEETSQYIDGSTSGYISLFPGFIVPVQYYCSVNKEPYIHPLALFTHVTVVTPSALSNGKGGPEAGSPPEDQPPQPRDIKLPRSGPRDPGPGSLTWSRASGCAASMTTSRRFEFEL